MGVPYRNNEAPPKLKHTVFNCWKFEQLLWGNPSHIFSWWSTWNTQSTFFFSVVILGIGVIHIITVLPVVQVITPIIWTIMMEHQKIKYFLFPLTTTYNKINCQRSIRYWRIIKAISDSTRYISYAGIVLKINVWVQT